VLELAGNGIGAEGTRRLAEAMRLNGSVEHLDLRWNGCGAEGAVLLASIWTQRRRAAEAKQVGLEGGVRSG
jgi:hypothetical protein